MSARQRTLEAIRRHFRDVGGAPSHRELALALGMRPTEIGRLLRQLAADGAIALQLGVARGIELLDRGDMLSDCELELAARRRGATMTWQAPAAAPLADAYHVEAGTDFSLSANDLLSQIDAAEQGERNGRARGFSGRS